MGGQLVQMALTFNHGDGGRRDANSSGFAVSRGQPTVPRQSLVWGRPGPSPW